MTMRAAAVTVGVVAVVGVAAHGGAVGGCLRGGEQCAEGGCCACACGGECCAAGEACGLLGGHGVPFGVGVSVK